MAAKVEILKALGKQCEPFRDQMQHIIDKQKTNTPNHQWLGFTAIVSYPYDWWDYIMKLNADSLELSSPYNLGAFTTTTNDQRRLELYSSTTDTVVTRMRHDGTGDAVKVYAGYVAHKIWKWYWEENPHADNGGDLTLWAERMITHVYDMIIRGTLSEREM